MVKCKEVEIGVIPSVAFRFVAVPIGALPFRRHKDRRYTKVRVVSEQALEYFPQETVPACE